MGGDKGIFEDLPIESAEEDLLQRVELAKKLAKIITASRPKTTSIVAITGEWGSGKTSFLNLVSQALVKVQHLPAVTQIHFSPSYFQDAEDLILLLSQKLEPRPNFIKSRWRKVLTCLRFNAVSIALLTFILTIVISAVVLIFFFNISLRIFFVIFGATLSVIALSGSTSLSQSTTRGLIQNQEKGLKEAQHRNSALTVVFVDEIDRWDNESICELFKFIKVNTVLTNFLFVLSYDRRIIEPALSSVHTSGKEYLEKLIQLEVPIPVVNDVKLHELIRRDVQLLIKTIDVESSYDERRLNEFVSKVLTLQISTLRSLKRYCSTVSFIYPSMKGEVDVLDFLAIMLLRVFQQDVYDELRWYKSELTETDRSTKSEELIERFSLRVKSWVADSAKDEKIVLQVLKFAFPNLRRFNLLDSKTMASEFLARGDSRSPLVSDKRFFQRYFSLVLSPYEFSDIRIRTFVGSKEKESELKSLLSTPLDTDKALLFVQRFAELGLHSGENTVESIIAIFDYLTDNGAYPEYALIQQDSRDYIQTEMLELVPAQAVENLTVSMLASIWASPSSAWAGWIEHIVLTVSSTSVAARVVDIIESRGEQWDQLDVNSALRRSIVVRLQERILKELNQGTLWNTANLSYILECLFSSQAAITSEIVSKISAYVQEDEVFITFLEKCRFPTATHYFRPTGHGISELTETWFSPKVLESVFGKYDSVIARLERIELSENIALSSKARQLYHEFEESKSALVI